MSSLKRTLPIICRSCRPLCSRSFHAVSLLAAKNSPKRAPTISRKLGNTTPVVHRAKKTYNPEECLPPIVFLQSARKSGALEIEVEKALDVLREYQELEGSSSKGWEQRLCNGKLKSWHLMSFISQLQDQGIKPATLALLGQILRRCKGEGQRHLARKLMLSASELGEKTATFALVSSAIRVGPMDSNTVPVQRCKQLAVQENDPQAMLLLGKVCLAEGKESEANTWFERAVQSPQGVGFEGSAEALVHVGRIRLLRRDETGAVAAFRRAALELDDPSAYFYLSQMEESGSSQQEVYLLKAASGGVVEASHNLGSIELAKIEKQGPKPKSVQDYGMAREWFQVAAADGFGPSMLNMASICKLGGQLEAGLKWLERAEQVPDVSEHAKSIKSQWGSPNIKLP